MPQATAKNPTGRNEDQRAEVLQLRCGAAVPFFIFIFKDYHLMIYVTARKDEICITQSKDDES